jgi:hypothetical protein
MPFSQLFNLSSIHFDGLFICQTLLAVLLVFIGLHLTITIVMLVASEFALRKVAETLLQAAWSTVDFSMALLQNKYTALFGRLLLEISQRIAKVIVPITKFTHIIIIITTAIVLLAIMAILILLIFTVQPIILGKAFMAIFMFLLSTVFIVLIMQCRNMAITLSQMEANMAELRDEVMFNGTLVRAQLSSLNNRLTSKQVISAQDISQQAVKSIGPLLWLFLRKEKSIYQWVIAGMNIGRAVFSYIKKKNDQA